MPSGCVFVCWLRFFIGCLVTTAPLTRVHCAAKVPWIGSKIKGSPEPPAPNQVTRVFPRLGFLNPVDLAFEPHGRRYWLLQLNGQLLSFPNEADPAKADLVFDLAPFCAAKKQPLGSSLGFTFHPGFATNRYLFIVYVNGNEEPEGSHLSRFRVTTDVPPTVDPTSEVQFLHWRGGGHNGSSLKFGPDGTLTISTGDSEAPEPPDRLKTGQNLDDFLAVILRIDVDHPADGKNYSIPLDNPFRHRPGARPEIWAYGFRNPWRTSFGPDGALWVGDVGWELWETIHRVTAGYNGGWSVLEGPQKIYADTKPPTPISEPMAAHPHSEAASITGGFFYHGNRLPRWRGNYIYGDWETGKIWALDPNQKPKPQPLELCDTTLKIIAFAPAAEGEMLILDYRDGQPSAGIYRLDANEQTATGTRFPRRLSESGLFTDLKKSRPATGVVPYQPVATMWADHATSERWLALPDTSAITTDRGHPWSEFSWTFPSNAVFAKTLSLEMTQGEPTSQRKIETQLLHFDGENWQAYSYRWNDAQSDADLVPAPGDHALLRIQDPRAPTGERTQNWRFSSRSECFRCHSFWSGMTIGFGWDSLGGKPLTGTAPTELARLVDLGMVSETRRLPNALSSLVDPTETSASLEKRARSWLHVNCAHCHRNGAGGAVSAYFSAEIPLDKLRILEVLPLRGNFGLSQARLLAAGEPWRSTIFHRVSTVGGGHMPALGSKLRDERGLTLLRDWIRTVASVPGTTPSENQTTASLVTIAAQSEGEARVAALRREFTNTSVALAAVDRSWSDPSFRSDAVTAAAHHENSAARELFQPWYRPDQIRQVLGEDFPATAVLALSGDAQRGRVLFHSETGPNCSRCHPCDGQGKNYGPDLSAIGPKYDAATLLRHITEPSLAIAPEFSLRLVEHQDGTSWSGFALPGAANEIVIRSEDGLHRWPVSEIAVFSRSDQSAMPAGLLASLTAAEAADLLAYLRKQPR